MDPKIKRLLIRLDEKTHMEYAIWCRQNGSTMQTVTENLIKGIMQATDPKSVAHFTTKNGGA